MTLCRDCRTDVVLCAACEALICPPPDATQLCLWPPQQFMRERRVLLLEEREPHFSHGVVATQAQRRKSPYH